MNSAFLTPAKELRSRLASSRPASSHHLFGLGPLLRKQFASRTWDRSLLHCPDASFEEWKQNVKPWFAECLVVPSSLGEPTDAVVVGREEYDGYVVEHIEFTVTPPLRAPATVVIPKNGRKRHPAIVTLHCMGGLRLYGREKLLAFPEEPEYLTTYRQTYYGGRSLQVELAQAGFLSIAIDAFNFGQRTTGAYERLEFGAWRSGLSGEQVAKFSFDTAMTEEPQALRALQTIGLDIASLTATDDLRTVDYLVQRDDVDPKRIGCTGLSFGSFRTNYLAALDDRIRAAASVCWLSSHRGIVDYNILGAMGFFALPPRMYQDFDMADIVALAAPKPFLAISGWRDALMEPRGISEAHMHFRETWRRAGVPQNLGSLVFDSPHEYNVLMQDKAIAFFQKHLSMPGVRLEGS